LALKTFRDKGIEGSFAIDPLKNLSLKALKNLNLGRNDKITQ
jgi:hypothetical protein